MKPLKRIGLWALPGLLLVTSSVRAQQTAAAQPALTEPVNDFAGVIDAESRAGMDRVIRALQAGTGDVIVVATVKDVEPYADIRDYAVRLFENQGRGIGERGKDNGLLVLLSTGDRRVWIEVGYGLEGAITDGFAGETTRQQMIPFFREGQYGAGLQAGVVRLASRIAQDRGVTLEGLPPARAAPRERRRQEVPIGLIVMIVLLILFLSNRRRGGRHRYWTSGPWSGWSGGVGPFGGTYGGWGGGGGGFSGGGFGGGGFGGFGGGRSGGGGGGGGW